jgi:PAS domain S-box-containing protein
VSRARVPRAAPTGFPVARFFRARVAVGVAVALLVALQRPGGGAYPNLEVALALLLWVAAGSGLVFLRRLLERHPRMALGCLLGGDTFAAAAVIWAIGGLGQPALLLIALPILAGGLLLLWRAGLILGLEAGLLYEVMALYDGHTLAAFDGLWSGIAYHTGIFVALGLGAGFLGMRAAAKLREAALARSELAEVQLSTDRIVESLGCGLIALDAQGRVRTVNRAARRLLDLAGEPGDLRQLFGGRHGALLKLLRRERERAGSERERELRLRGRDGRGFPVLVKTAAVVTAAGERHGLVALIWDLSERERQEEAARKRERLAAVGELAAGLAHEIRNSLKPITGCIELIEKQGALPPRMRPMMEVITREADSLEAFLSQFLALAQDKSLKLEPIDLDDLIGREVAALTAADARADARVVIGGGGGICLRGDRERLRLIFRNLILNGLEANPQGLVRVELERFARRSRPWVRVRIHDEGSGFGRLDFGEALKPFRTSKPAGTGLGLPTALRGVREHGGRLSLDPREPVGATLIVELPLDGPAEGWSEAQAA